MSTLRSIPGRQAALGPDMVVHRLLPTRGLRTVGPWCFIDHFGPVRVSADDFAVGPHPHIGLQTVTWLLAGEIVHGDSLGSRQPIRPGQLNLMTSGAGITHWEIPEFTGQQTMHGLQMWVALPDSVRQSEPHFEHHADLPSMRRGDMRITVFMGRLEGLRSPATTWSPMVGAELRIPAGGAATLPVDPRFEHALVVAEGALQLDGQQLDAHVLHDLGRDRQQLDLRADVDTTALLLGGEPFPGPVLMWWNFVARTADEIERARSDWEAGRGFGDPTRFPGPPLPAPPLPGGGLRLKG